MPAQRPLPPPEWFEEFRLLNLRYGREYDAIMSMDLTDDQKDGLATTLWVETDRVRRRLMTNRPPSLRCTVVKPDGQRCARPVRPDYIGQMCSSHAPHIRDYPDLVETRRLWLLHEGNGELRTGGDPSA